ncbi:hypothetical protein MKL09_01640 [Methylobacterium sp. J-048]|uniref:hypothetical protein n=1 Tax=Methylobacterium sp. J-048 TaxID=2836635 RepID=UPI001FBB88BD|nr:hypothetical protein [Methylobacterium sp. J-048]MCJ2055250.1 hypothetical protein [Methylobacterium sp. J-048]
MKERLSRAAVVAALCLIGWISPAHAAPVDVIRDFDCRPLAFRDADSVPRMSASGQPRLGQVASLDTLLSRDPFARTVTCFGGGGTFPGLISPPAIGYATADASYGVKGSTFGGAGGGSGASGHTATGLVALSPYGESGASAGFFLSDTGFGGGSGGSSGGAPAPEIDAMLGLTLAGGTVAFLKRRRRAPAAV